MSESSPPASIRALIDQFIHDRFQTKTEKLAPDDPAYLKLQQQFEPQTWLADAARRVSQLQVVTHSLKAVHPDAKGTNLYVEPGQLDRGDLVGSHCLPADFEGDVVGNAAALDVYKFLKLQWEGRSLLERALTGDEALIEALGDDRAEAQSWVQAFANIVEPRGAPSSHARGKQLYWLIGDEPGDDTNYRLLAPLYATALAHRVYAQFSLNTWFYGDHNKAARKALKEKMPFECGYTSYPNLAIQKFGGTKPQNISQLNSERGGQNYLLASLPPHWQSREVTAPLRTESVLPRFGRRAPVRQLLNDLIGWMQQNIREDERRLQQAKQPRKTMQDRNLHDDLVASLVDELLLFTFELHRLPAGWSADAECRLVVAEQYWLDPGRAALESDFDITRRQSDWHEEVAQRIARWLRNTINRRVTASLGDPEHAFWAGQIETVMQRFHRQLDDLQDALRDDDDEGEAA